MLSSEQKVQECDATDDHSSNIAGFIIHFLLIPIQTIISRITFPATSVNLKGLPWNGYVNSS